VDEDVDVDVDDAGEVGAPYGVGTIPGLESTSDSVATRFLLRNGSIDMSRVR
jgi:hypothetical protein